MGIMIIDTDTFIHNHMIVRIWMVPRQYLDHASVLLLNEWLKLYISPPRMTINFLHKCMRLKCSKYIQTVIHIRRVSTADPAIERIQQLSDSIWFKFYPPTDNKYDIIHDVDLVHATRLMRDFEAEYLPLIGFICIHSCINKCRLKVLALFLTVFISCVNIFNFWWKLDYISWWGPFQYKS